jgi:hypothetical protein
VKELQTISLLLTEKEKKKLIKIFSSSFTTWRNGLIYLFFVN